MSKKGVRIYVDVSEWEQFKNENNASEKIRDFIRQVNGTDNSKQERIKEINEQIKDLKNKISEAQQTIADLQSEKQVLEQEIQKENSVDDQEEKFIKICKRKIEENDWTDPQHINGYWKNELDANRQELWEMAKSSNIKPAEPKKA